MQDEDVQELKSALSGLYSMLDMAKDSNKMAGSKIRDTYQELDDNKFLEQNTIAALRIYLNGLSDTRGLKLDKNAVCYCSQLDQIEQKYSSRQRVDQINWEIS